MVVNKHVRWSYMNHMNIHTFCHNFIPEPGDIACFHFLFVYLSVSV